MDTLTKLSMASKAATLAHKILLLTSLGTVLAASPGWAVGIKPTSMTVTVPSGSNNPQADGSTHTYNINNKLTPPKLAGSTTAATQTYIDDMILNSITFGSGGSAVTFQKSSSAFRFAQQAQVTVGRDVVNADYGEQDTNSDGNPNPFVSAKVPQIQESTDPKIQDRAIQAAFSSLSLLQGVDGEGPNYTFKLIFKQGIVDNSTAVDQVPELVFFERGINSDFTVQVITGGTFSKPTLSNPVTVLRGDMRGTGISINTIDPAAPTQELGVVGLDLNEFGITNANSVVYGVRISSINNSGADIYGQFLSATNPTSQFKNVPSQLVPEPLTILGSGMALGFGALMQRQYSRKRKEI